MEVKYIFIAINIAGLILDFVGFIKIYKTKLNLVAKMENMSSDYIIRLKYGSSKSSSDLIIEKVNNKIESINKNYKNHNKETLPYFMLVVYGVSLQIISAFLFISYEIIFR